jgi:hypothetical protein
MESMERETRGATSLSVGERGQDGLRRAGSWGRLLAIIGFIVAAFTTISGLFLFAAREQLIQAELGIPAPLISAIYLVIGIITFIISRHLWQFAERTELAIRTEDSDLLSEGLHKLGAMMKLTGIFVIISVVFFILFFIAITLLALLKL